MDSELYELVTSKVLQWVILSLWQQVRRPLPDSILLDQEPVRLEPILFYTRYPAFIFRIGWTICYWLLCFTIVLLLFASVLVILSHLTPSDLSFVEGNACTSEEGHRVFQKQSYWSLWGPKLCLCSGEHFYSFCNIHSNHIQSYAVRRQSFWPCLRLAGIWEGKLTKQLLDLYIFVSRLQKVPPTWLFLF